jgi:hypothetical protein
MRLYLIKQISQAILYKMGNFIRYVYSCEETFEFILGETSCNPYNENIYRLYVFTKNNKNKKKIIDEKNVMTYIKDFVTVSMEHYIIIDMMYMNDTEHMKVYMSQFIDFIRKYLSLIKSFHLLICAEIDIADNNAVACEKLLLDVLEISITISEYYENVINHVNTDSDNIIDIIIKFSEKFNPSYKIKNIYDLVK